MKLKKEEFKTLRKHWYDLAKKTGFNDIEKLAGDNLVLSQNSSHCFRDSDPSLIKAKEEYYALISQAVENEETVFRNEVDKHILTRHAEGAKIKKIVEELKMLGMPRERKSVRIIIRRYEMAWNIKFYTPKQLNMKTHD